MNRDYQSMLDIAIEEAELGLAEGGIPIGAALFDKTGRLLGRGHNRRIQDDDPSIHGETDAFRKAGRMGIDIAPPMPAFYNQPQSVDDIVNHTVGRVLDLFDLDSGIVNRWQGARGHRDDD